MSGVSGGSRPDLDLDSPGDDMASDMMTVILTTPGINTQAPAPWVSLSSLTSHGQTNCGAPNLHLSAVSLRHIRWQGVNYEVTPKLLRHQVHHDILFPRAAATAGATVTGVDMAGARPAS